MLKQFLSSVRTQNKTPPWKQSNIFHFKKFLQVILPLTITDTLLILSWGIQHKAVQKDDLKETVANTSWISALEKTLKGHLIIWCLDYLYCIHVEEASILRMGIFGLRALSMLSLHIPDNNKEDSYINLFYNNVELILTHTQTPHRIRFKHWTRSCNQFQKPREPHATHFTRAIAPWISEQIHDSKLSSYYQRHPPEAVLPTCSVPDPLWSSRYAPLTAAGVGEAGQGGFSVQLTPLC